MSKRDAVLNNMCYGIMDVLKKRIRDTRLKIERTRARQIKIVSSDKFLERSSAAMLLNNYVISFWREQAQQKQQSDNTNKIIVSQDFGGNKYSKIV